MVPQSPRIYIYKITFEEVKYYYYGVHKERKYGEEYWGSPVTNKWCWELYTPKKQILELFDFTDDGWLEANLVEDRLIKPVYNTDKWCLNEHCGGIISMEAKRKSGKYCVENKIGIHGFTPEERKEKYKNNGNRTKELKIGIHALTTEQRKENGSRNGKKCKERGTGIFSQSKEQLSENSKKANSQRWMCTETNYVSNAGGLSTYQKARGIDTSKRVRIS
jgi:hypothetical protein